MTELKPVRGQSLTGRGDYGTITWSKSLQAARVFLFLIGLSQYQLNRVVGKSDPLQFDPSCESKKLSACKGLDTSGQIGRVLFAFKPPPKISKQKAQPLPAALLRLWTSNVHR